MNYNDWLVGLVSAGIGTTTLLAGALNWDWTYQYRPARWIESAYGRGAARAFYAVLGIFLIVLGVAITQGWGFNRPRTYAGNAPARGFGAFSGASRWRPASWGTPARSGTTRPGISPARRTVTTA